MNTPIQGKNGNRKRKDIYIPFVLLTDTFKEQHGYDCSFGEIIIFIQANGM
jgi:hypothetical protein